MSKPNAMLFMKVGEHAGESFESILKRKQREKRDAGCIFWGYGGTACHPINQVRPFVKNFVKNINDEIYLYMEPINSKANPAIVPATEYSVDGKVWSPIPRGITVTGSKYALVMDEIQPGELEFSLNEYEVAIGPSMGKLASDYLTGHIDKACLRRKEDPQDIHQKIRKATLTAKLLDPYAVILR